MTVYLDVEDLADLVEVLGVGPVRDAGLLHAAAERPGTTWRGSPVYPTLDLRAAALLESLVGNHPLVDGNKRLGWLAVVVFYEVNGVVLDAPEDPAYDLVIAVATRAVGLAEVAGVLRSWVCG